MHLLEGLLRSAGCGAYCLGMPRRHRCELRERPLSFFFFESLSFYFFMAVADFSALTLSFGHTTVKAPYPIRTAQLSTVGPDQYYGRGLRGNLRCCKAFFFVWSRSRGFESRCRPAGAVHDFFKYLVLRSYHGESTVSHPNCAVKHRWA